MIDQAIHDLLWRWLRMPSGLSDAQVRQGMRRILAIEAVGAVVLLIWSLT